MVSEAVSIRSYIGIMAQSVLGLLSHLPTSVHTLGHLLKADCPQYTLPRTVPIALTWQPSNPSGPSTYYGPGTWHSAHTAAVHRTQSPPPSLHLPSAGTGGSCRPELPLYMQPCRESRRLEHHALGGSKCSISYPDRLP